MLAAKPKPAYCRVFADPCGGPGHVVRATATAFGWTVTHESPDHPVPVSYRREAVEDARAVWRSLCQDIERAGFRRVL